ncbi:MAG: amidohydrolase family protein [Enterocloster bolteae]
MKELCPWSEFYGDAYDHFGMFGSGVKTIMAHCVWPPEKEIQRMRDNGVYVAHCPQSNTNLSSGIAPVRTYLEQGIPTGLGTDVAGGAGESVFRAMADAIQVSKLRWRLVDETCKPLRQRRHSTWEQRAAADSSERLGSFEEGYELDALVLNDESLKHPQPLSLKERLERFIYLSDERHIDAKYVAGRKIF